MFLKIPDDFRYQVISETSTSQPDSPGLFSVSDLIKDGRSFRRIEESVTLLPKTLIYDVSYTLMIPDKDQEVLRELLIKGYPIYLNVSYFPKFAPLIETEKAVLSNDTIYYKIDELEGHKQQLYLKGFHKGRWVEMAHDPYQEYKYCGFDETPARIDLKQIAKLQPAHRSLFQCKRTLHLTLDNWDNLIGKGELRGGKQADVEIQHLDFDEEKMIYLNNVIANRISELLNTNKEVIKGYNKEGSLVYFYAPQSKMLTVLEDFQFTELSVPLSTIEYLKLDRSGVKDLAKLPLLSNLLTDLNNLKKLFIKGKIIEHFFSTDSILNFPLLAQIEYLEIQRWQDYVRTNDLLPLLKKCTQLKELTTDFPLPTRGLEPNDYPNLECLYFSSSVDEYETSHANSLQLVQQFPALKALHFEGELILDSNKPHLFKTLSVCNIFEPKSTYLGLDPATLICILQSAPNLNSYSKEILNNQISFIELQTRSSPIRTLELAARAAQVPSHNFFTQFFTETGPSFPMGAMNGGKNNLAYKGNGIKVAGNPRFNLNDIRQCLENGQKTLNEDEAEEKRLSLITVKNQGMVIEQFIKFLTVRHKKIEASPEQIREGMCSALSHYCADNNVKEWNAILTAIQTWDGELKSLNQKSNGLLRNIIFNNLIHYYRKYQLPELSLLNWIFKNGIHKPYTYIGLTQAIALINTSQDSLCFSNNWHAITVSKHFFYDPNRIDGGLIYSSEAELSSLLLNSLGPHIKVEGEYHLNLPLLGSDHDKRDFLEAGGIMYLISSQNREALYSELHGLSFTSEALEGLFLVSNGKTPAWWLGLKSSFTTAQVLTLKMMAAYVQAMPIGYWDRFEKSCESLNINFIDAIHQVLKRAAQLRPSRGELEQLKTAFERLIPLLGAPREQMRKAFRTWTEKDLEEKPQSLDAFSYDILNASSKSTLIKSVSEEQTQALYLSLLNCSERNNDKWAVFSIDEPIQLSCSTPFVRREGDRGAFKLGPGGPLYDFLTQKETGDRRTLILLINMDKFPSFIRFNTLLDAKPNVDGLPLPQGSRVIALRNIHGAYNGSDLQSRFDVKLGCPFSPETMPLPTIPQFTEAASSNTQEIELYEADDWRERLLGQWLPEGQSLRWKPGLLQSGMPLVLINPPQTQEFMDFIRKAQALSYVDYQGTKFDLSQGIALSERDYPYASWKSCLQQVQRGVVTNAFVLNKRTFFKLFHDYSCNIENKGLDHLAGVLDSGAAGGTLRIQVSHPLKPSQWAYFLSQCVEKDIKIDLFLALGVDLPGVLQPESMDELPPLEAREHTEIINSSDSDATVHNRFQENSWREINVSECKAQDLLTSFNGAFDKEKALMAFEPTTGLFQTNKHFILTGNITSDLEQALTPFLLERMGQTDASFKLVIIKNNPKTLSFLPQENDEVALGEPLSRQRAREAYLALYPDRNADESWQGLEYLPAQFDLGIFDPKTSAAEADAFDEDRYNEVNYRLSNQNMVVITGLTGVGKSTFIKEVLKPRSERPVFEDLKQITAWAKSAEGGRLFSDEFTLSNIPYSIFEGLYAQKPYIRIDNEPFELTDKHQLIVAGNPVSYGGGRTLPPFFERHGNALIFKPMPLSYIYERMLKPLFRDNEEQGIILSTVFLDLYAFLCGCSTSRVLISPRELQTMALLSMAHLEGKSDDPTAVAQFWVRQIAKDLVPRAYQAEFDEKFPEQPLSLVNKLSKDKAYLYTPSRQTLAHLLEDMVKLRKNRRLKQGNEGIGDAYLFGGLCSLLIEGQPGIGKSEIVLQVLKDLEVPAEEFIHIKVSEDTKTKKRKLKQALKEGKFVLIDEFNSGVDGEDGIESKFMYDLLTNVDTKGRRPYKPGFMLIGTQNPASMGGNRTVFSQALARRSIQYQLAPYTLIEMLHIAQSKGLSFTQASVMVASFREKEEEAKQNAVEPKPCFRDFDKELNKYIEEHLHLKNGPGSTPYLPFLFSDNQAPILIVSEDSETTEELSDNAGELFEESDESIQVIEEKLSEEVEKLLAAIDNLKVYGEKLQLQKNSERVGEGAINLAIELSSIVTSNKKAIPFQLLRTKISDSYQEMGEHRSLVKPVLVNILIVLTGLLNAIVTFSVNKVTNGCWFFSPRTKRQKIVDSINETIDKMDQTGPK